MASQAPVSFLIDYDGTISRADASNAILDRHTVDDTWLERDRLYEAGLIGSRDLLDWDTTLLPDDEAALYATAMEQPEDGTFPAFVETARRWGADIEVVSDGFGWYVPAALERVGVRDLAVASARMRFRTGSGHPEITFPAGHPACFVCGTCKRERVREHHRRGHVVVYIGDGTSDRYGAAHAELIFAKGRLAEWCEADGWPHIRWSAFDEIARWTEDAFASGRLPRHEDELSDARAELVAARWPGESVAVHPEERHFVCGPEVWGPGLHDPPLEASRTLASIRAKPRKGGQR